MYRRVSETARHGGLTRGQLVIGEDVKRRMRAVLDEVRSGKYAEEWRKSWENEGPNAFEKHLRELDQHPIEIVGRELRRGMWPGEDIV